MPLYGRKQTNWEWKAGYAEAAGGKADPPDRDDNTKGYETLGNEDRSRSSKAHGDDWMRLDV
jgi:hypothetical protein